MYKAALADIGRQLSLGTDDGILSRISIEASRGQEPAQTFRVQIIEQFAWSDRRRQYVSPNAFTYLEAQTP